LTHPVKKPEHYGNEMFFPPQNLHFIGIGGIGMSGLAEIAVALGCTVSGSDLASSATTLRLQSLGVTFHRGHDAANLGQADAVIVTSAASPDNPELAEARRRGLPIVRRGELLAELMRPRFGLAVAGSHGKSTTSAMIASVAIAAGLDPTVVVGARLPVLGGASARLGHGVHCIAESDESDGSFLDLSPVIAVITNIDREHLDYYSDLNAILRAFETFGNRPPHYGSLIACVDDPNVRLVLQKVRRRVHTYGRAEDAEFRISNQELSASGGEFDLARHGQPLGRFRVPALGSHNVLNATATVAAGLEIGVSVEQIRTALQNFQGLGRRLEIKGTEQGITVVDDYGHHPTEIRATLAAARLSNPGRLVVLFQPHRFTRTQALLEEFAGAFDDADAVRILDIYAASEQPIDGISGEEVARRIQNAGHPDACYTGSLTGTVAHTLVELRPGDLVLTLGAGSITQAGDLILKGLRGDQ